MKPHDYQKELKQAFQERYRALLIKYQFRRILGFVFYSWCWVHAVHIVEQKHSS